MDGITFVLIVLNGEASVELAIERSRVLFSDVTPLYDESGQVVYTHMCLCHQAVYFYTDQMTAML